MSTLSATVGGSPTRSPGKRFLPKPSLRQELQICRHPGSLWAFQTGTRTLCHRSIYIRTQWGGRVPTQDLLRKTSWSSVSYALVTAELPLTFPQINKVTSQHHRKLDCLFNNVFSFKRPAVKAFPYHHAAPQMLLTSPKCGIDLFDADSGSIIITSRIRNLKGYLWLSNVYHVLQVVNYLFPLWSHPDFFTRRHCISSGQTAPTKVGIIHSKAAGSRPLKRNLVSFLS